MLWKEPVLKLNIPWDVLEIVQCFGDEITVEKKDSPYNTFYNLRLELEYVGVGTLADLIKQRNKMSEDYVKEYRLKNDT